MQFKRMIVSGWRDAGRLRRKND